MMVCVLYDRHSVFWNAYGAVFLALWLRLILLSDGDVATFKSPCCDMHVSFTRALPSQQDENRPSS